jgi:hypothetical protein
MQAPESESEDRSYTVSDRVHGNARDRFAHSFAASLGPDGKAAAGPRCEDRSIFWRLGGDATAGLSRGRPGDVLAAS